jgi:hypothetical protein
VIWAAPAPQRRQARLQRRTASGAVDFGLQTLDPGLRLVRWGAALALCALLAGARTAGAHDLGPLRTVRTSAGPYALVVTFYDPPRPRRPLRFAVDPAPGTALLAIPGGRPQISAALVPNGGQSGAAIAAALGPHVDGGAATGGVAGSVTPPATGAWLLSIAVRGPQGIVNADVPLAVSEPAALSPWLAWAIGLLPVWALLGFVGIQAWRAWRAGALADLAGVDRAATRLSGRQTPRDGGPALAPTPAAQDEREPEGLHNR